MITIDHLTRRYGSHLVVDDVSFAVGPGSVTGFLGPNGAGKSTTLRMLLGLTRPTSGRALIDGRRYAELPNPARHVGVLLDAAAQHGGRTGAQTLTLAARLIGAPLERVDALTAAVDLAPGAARRRVRSYSLGMRQRLGIALALLGEPRVLVLDEPVNGLDPFGIGWMRDLLADFAARGGSVLLSSHLLAEVEAVADHVVLIDHGRILAQGPTATLLPENRTVARSAAPVELARALDRAGLAVRAVEADGVEVAAPPAQVRAVAAVVEHPLTGLAVRRGAGLEALFFSLAGGAGTSMISPTFAPAVASPAPTRTPAGVAA